MSEFGVGHIGWTVGFGHTADERKEQYDMLAQMMRSSGRPLHIGGGIDAAPWYEACRAEGLTVLAQELALPVPAQFTLAEYNLFDYMPNWVQPLVGSIEDRMAKLSVPATREAMKRDVEENREPIHLVRTDWNRVRVVEAAYERNYKYDGLSMAEIGSMQGKHPLDAFLDLAVDEQLQTEFSHPAAQEDEEIIARGITDPHSHVSNSDGGAHTRFLTVSTWPVYFLSHWVRDKELLSLEEGHYKISALPAWFSDFKGRGTLRVGNWADVIVYNQADLGFMYDRAVFDTDFPGGRAPPDSEAYRYALHPGQWRSYLRGEQLHRSLARQAAPQLRHGRLAGLTQIVDEGDRKV